MVSSEVGKLTNICTEQSRRSTDVDIVHDKGMHWFNCCVNMNMMRGRNCFYRLHTKCHLRNKRSLTSKDLF